MLRAWGSLPAYPRRVLLRLALLPAIVFVLFSSVFLLAEVLPDVRESGHFGPEATDEQIRALRHELGLDRSTREKYEDFWQRIFTLDFGKSYVNNRPVGDSFRKRWGASAEMAIFSVLFSVAVAFAAGLAPAMRRPTSWRSAIRFVGAAVAAAPLVALVLYGLLYPVIWWDYIPPLGKTIRFFDRPIDNLQQFVPAALTMGLVLGVWSARLVRHELAEAALSVRGVSIAGATVAADVFPWILGGLVFVEQTYTIPGLGNFAFVAIFTHDTKTAEAMLLLFTSVALVAWTLRPALPRRPTTTSRSDRHRARHNPLLLVGAGLAVAYVVVGIIGPWIAPYEVWEFVGKNNGGPSFDHLLGTDKLGRDIFSRLLYANRTSLKLTAMVLAAGFLPGLITGALLSRGPARVRSTVVEGAEIWLSMPLVIISLMFVFTFWPGFKPLAICFGIHAFMLALRAGGHSLDDFSVTSAHHWVPVVGAAAIAAAATILGETTVGFLGLGIPYEASWGGEISKARESLPYHHWAAWSPFVAVLISTFGFLLIRTGLDDVDPPRMYER